MLKRVATIILGVAMAAALAACSSDANPAEVPPGHEERPSTLAGAPEPVELGGAGPATSTSSATRSSGESGTCSAADVEVRGSFGQRPSVTIPRDCAAPTELVIKDLEPGSGTRATEGSTVKVRYQLVSWSSGEVVDGNYGGQLFTMRNVGNNSGVIEGWNKGLLGIREGGRRLLIVPPELAYGQTGNGPIGPNETLVFVVDAVSVRQG